MAASGLYPNPRVGYQASEISDEGQAGQQGAFFGQEIVTAGKLQRSRDVACQAVQQAQWAWPRNAGACQSDVRRAFYDVLVAQRTVELTEQLVRIGQEGVRAAEACCKAKEVSRVDVLQAADRGRFGPNPGRKGPQPPPGRLAEPGGGRRRGRHAAGAAGGRDSRRPGAT